MKSMKEGEEQFHQAESNEGQEELRPLYERIIVALMQFNCPVGDDSCYTNWLNTNVESGDFQDAYEDIITQHPDIEDLFVKDKSRVMELFNERLGPTPITTDIKPEDMFQSQDVEEGLEDAA